MSIYVIIIVVNRQDCYRIEALVELAQVFPSQLTAAEIARRRNIPEKFLSRLLSEMARQGVVVTTRGPSGGIRLAVPPQDILITSLLPGIGSTVIGSPAMSWLQNTIDSAQRVSLTGVTLSTLIEVEGRSQAHCSFEI